MPAETTASLLPSSRRTLRDDRGTVSRLGTVIALRRHFFKPVGGEKVIHGNGSDSHCNRSDTWPSMLLVELY